jgi:hypothetical protein
MKRSSNHGGREEAIPRSLTSSSWTFPPGWWGFPWTCFSHSVRNRPHYGLHGKSLCRLAFDRLSAGRTSILRGWWLHKGKLVPCLLLHMGREVAQMCWNGWISIVIRMGSHVLCESRAEPLFEAGLTEGMAATESVHILSPFKIVRLRIKWLTLTYKDSTSSKHIFHRR